MSWWGCPLREIRRISNIGFRNGQGKRGLITIGMTGEGGGKMAPVSDYLIAIPSKNTPRIQEAHMLLGHIICELVEAQYFSK